MNALDKVFGTDHDATDADDRTSDYKGSAAYAGADDILADIDAILAALVSEDAFVAATDKGGKGVLNGAALSAADAQVALDHTATATTATLMAQGSTRFGTFL